MAGRAIEVEGLADFRRDLRAAGSGWPRELSKVHRTLAKDVAGEARKFARGVGGSTAHFAGTIYGIGSASKAAVGNRKEGNAAIWGAKRRTGWYGRQKYRRSTGQQHPKWVGDSWDVGGPGGPYGINDAVRHDLPFIERHYAKAIDDLMRRAFPD